MTPALAGYFEVCDGCAVNNKDFAIGKGGEISGQVLDEQGDPVVANVYFYSTGAKDRGDTLLGTTQTQLDGTYSVSGMPWGTYKIGFTNGNNDPTHTSALPPGKNGLHNQWYGARNSYDSAAMVSITLPEQSITGINVVLHDELLIEESTVLGVDSYVALGDSYQSGEGAYDYMSTTDTADNRCHRSENAYSQVIGSTPIVSGYQAVEFWACSGQTMSSMSTTTASNSGPPWDDPQRMAPELSGSSSAPLLSSLDRLSGSTGLVTIGIGGNDMGFVPILTDCVKAFYQSQIYHIGDASCQEQWGEAEDTLLAGLVSSGAWEGVFDQIRARAPYARVLALGYPRIFQDGPNPSICLPGSVRPSDEIWMNDLILRINAAIESAAESRNIQYVDIYNVSDGAEMCSGAPEPFFNGLIPGIGDGSIVLSESYHPTDYGHALIAQEVQKALMKQQLGVPFIVSQGETHRIVQTIAPSSPSATFSILAASGVNATLTSPSGREIDASSIDTDVHLTVTSNAEVFLVDNPEEGPWTISVYGSSVSGGGVEANAGGYSAPQINARPTGAITLTQEGFDIHVDSIGSADPDGSLVNYLWDFGDGTTSSGAIADHTYSVAGTYVVTLVVTDNGGAKGFVSSSSPVAIEEESDVVAFNDYEKDDIGVTAGSSSTIAVVSNSDSVSGTHSLALSSQDDGYWVGESDVVGGLTIGRSYTVSAWVNPEDSGAYIWDIAIGVNGIGQSSSATAGQGWQFVSYSFTATSTEHEVDFGYNGAESDMDPVYWDDVILLQDEYSDGAGVHPAEVIASNAYDQQRIGVTSATSYTSLVRTGASSHSGSRALAMSSGLDGYWVGATDTISGLEVGRTYVLTGWVSAYGSSGLWDIAIGVDGLGQSDGASTSGWQKLTYEFVATSSSHEIYMGYNGATSASPPVYWDDIALTASAMAELP